MRKDVFNVLCVSTVSAGKSMLLNALLGRNILPTRSALCTTKVHRLFGTATEDVVRCRARTSPRGRPAWKVGNREVLDELGRGHCLDIELEVSFPKIGIVGKKPRLCLVDTPGTNSTHPANHAGITHTLLAAADYKCLIVVMNGVYQGTNDERLLLERVASVCAVDKMRKPSILFVLSMMDKLDVDESPVDRMQETHAYLASLGFKEPVVIPVMARRCLIIRSLPRGLAVPVGDDVMHRDDMEHLVSQLPRYETQLQSWHEAHRLVFPDGFLMDKITYQYAAILGIPKIVMDNASIDLDLLGRVEWMTGIPILECVLREFMENEK